MHRQQAAAPVQALVRGEGHGIDHTLSSACKCARLPRTNGCRHRPRVLTAEPRKQRPRHIDFAAPGRTARSEHSSLLRTRHGSLQPGSLPSTRTGSSRNSQPRRQKYTRGRTQTRHLSFPVQNPCRVDTWKFSTWHNTASGIHDSSHCSDCRCLKAQLTLHGIHHRHICRHMSSSLRHRHTDHQRWACRSLRGRCMLGSLHLCGSKSRRTANRYPTQVSARNPREHQHSTLVSFSNTAPRPAAGNAPTPGE